MHITPSYLLRAFRSRKLQLFSMSGRHFKKKSLKVAQPPSIPYKATENGTLTRFFCPPTPSTYTEESLPSPWSAQCQDTCKHP